jgi:hypothetical protein
MRDPNSPLIRLRVWIVKRIDPYPDPGESWCLGCALNRGRTLVLALGSITSHVQQHRDDGSDVTIRTSERAQQETA